MLLGGVEVADDYADYVVVLELARRAEAFFDVLHLLRYFFGEIERHFAVLVLDLEEDYRVYRCMDAEQVRVGLDSSNQFQCLFFVGFNRLSNLLQAVMQKGVIKLNGVVSPSETDDPIFVVHDIVILGEVVFEEAKLEGFCTEGLV